MAQPGRGVLRHHHAPALRRGDFASVEELVAAIGRFCHAWNQRCQPFVWVKDAEEILARFARHPTLPGR
jgi:hypothetical protein